MVNPAMLLLVGVMTGIGGAVTYAAFNYAEKKEFGKGSITPLESLRRGQAVNDLLPMPPEQGPPLPQGLRIRWPWGK